MDLATSGFYSLIFIERSREGRRLHGQPVCNKWSHLIRKWLLLLDLKDEALCDLSRVDIPSGDHMSITFHTLIETVPWPKWSHVWLETFSGLGQHQQSPQVMLCPVIGGQVGPSHFPLECNRVLRSQQHLEIGAIIFPKWPYILPRIRLS